MKLPCQYACFCMKNILNKYLPVFFIIITFIPSRSYANHIIGADITWKHYKADTFLFTASVYRSCRGMKLTNSPFTYFGTSTGYTTPQTVYGTMCCTKDVTPGAYGCDQCNSSACAYPYGTELITINVKIAFPSGCCDWFVSWQQNYRDGAISTGPAGEVFYVEAEINTCLSQPDNSPSFNIPTNDIFCVNQCNMMDNSATDIDRSATNKGDSLVYLLVSPLQSHGKSVNYKKGYDYEFPFDAARDSVPCIDFAMDPHTGILKFQPTQMETSVMAIEVDEWRKDTSGMYHKIGSIRRDIETYVEDCGTINNHAPIIPGINGGTTYTETICSEQQTCFQVKAFDLDLQDTDYLSWHPNDSMKGASFTLVRNGQKWPTAVFCWYPDTSMGRPQPYTFTVTATDNNIPQASASKTFFIYVTGPPKATYTAVNKCGIVTFNAQADANSGPIGSYLWVGQGTPGYGPLYKTGHNATYAYTKSGMYHYTLVITNSIGCSVSYNDSIYVHVGLETGLPQDTIVCSGSPGIKLTARVKGWVPPYSYIWNTGETSPTKTATITKDTFFSIMASDAEGCTGVDSIHIHFQKPPLPHAATVIYKCRNSGVQLNSTDISSNLTWKAIFPNKTVPNFSDSSPLTVNDSGIYIATAANNSVCPGTDSFIVKNSPFLLKNDTFKMCYGNGLNFTYPDRQFWIDSGSGWKPDTNLTIYISFRNPSGYIIKHPVSLLNHGSYCPDTQFDHFIIYPRPKNLIEKSFPELCTFDKPINLNDYVNPLYKNGSWSYYDKSLASTDTILNPSLMGITYNDSNAGYVKYSYIYHFGCSSTETSRIMIWSKVSAGPDDTIWKECGKYVLNNSSVAPRYGGNWTTVAGTPASCLEYSGDTVLFNPDSVPGNGRYGFVYSYNNKADSSSCFGSDTVYINLITKPVISFNPIDSLCDDANPFHITVSPPGGQLVLSDSTNPAALQGNTLYPVIAGPGYHRLRYVAGHVKPNRFCTDTAGIGFKVIRPPDADFKTQDSSIAYCASHGAVKLIPKTKGGFFTGASYIKNDTAYFDPSVMNIKDTAKSFSISYILPYYNKSCDNIVSHDITVYPAQRIKIISPSYLCGNDGVYTILASEKYCTSYQWLAYDSAGQDEGYFGQQKQVDTILSATFVPGSAQLKRGYFEVYLIGNGSSGCSSIRDSGKIFFKPGPIPDFLSLNRVGCDPLLADFKNLTIDTNSIISKYGRFHQFI